MSSFFNIWGSNFNDFYQSPDVVTIAIFLLMFILAYTSLRKTVVKDLLVSSIISFVIATSFIFYLREWFFFFETFNLILFIAAVGVAFFIGKAFFKFFRNQF